MAESSFSFRCAKCNKLLGVTLSRVGSMVACPKCNTTQVVPEPPAEEVEIPVETGSRRAPVAAPVAYEEPSPRPAAAAVPAQEYDLGIGGLVLDSEPLSIRTKDAKPGRGSERARAVQTVAPSPAPAPVAPPTPPPIVTAPANVADPMAFVTAATTAAPTSLSAAPPAERARRNDVILPRSAVQLWSFLVLLCAIFAFMTGLFAGHFLWKSAPPAASAPEKPAQPAA